MELDDETLRNYSSLHMDLIMPIILYSMDTFLHRIEGFSAFKEVKKNLEWPQYKNCENSVLGDCSTTLLRMPAQKPH